LVHVETFWCINDWPVTANSGWCLCVYVSSYASKYSVPLCVFVGNITD
jgi:hypothetical protein